MVEQDPALRQAAGQAFYNTSKFTLRDLRARATRQQLKADFEAYLDGFSPNVQDILDNFEFRNQIPRLSKADALGTDREAHLAGSQPEPGPGAERRRLHPPSRPGQYRTRLIADVVTGKLDLREAAAGLPEVDPLAAEDDSDDGANPKAWSDGDELGVTGQEAEA